MPKDLSAQQVGLQGGSKAQDPKMNVVTGRTRFPMSYNFINTYRYGHCQPFYYCHTVGDDDIPLFSEHQLSTHTLASPFRSDINLNKTYFLVDYKAIYPRNWNLMYVNPNKGDDVPSDTRLVVNNLIQSAYLRFKKFKSESNFTLDGVTDLLRFILYLESVFSTGSLFSQFNLHLHDFVRYFDEDDVDKHRPLSFDNWFDTLFVPELSLGDLQFTIGGNYYNISPTGDSYQVPGMTTYYVSLRRALELMRDNNFKVTRFDSTGLLEVLKLLDIQNIANYPLNLEVLAAYQLGCAQFFTDSNVDYVYSAELYRDSMESLYINTGNFNLAAYTFTYNGNKRLYDVLSGFVVNRLLTFMGNLSVGDTGMFPIYDYFLSLFGHRNSLRFRDYFVGGRVNPLAVGDVAVNTSGASVSVIDITRKIQLQRFLNSVNVSRQKIGEYARNVLGLSNADDNSYDIPAWLGTKSLPIHGMEVENTGSEQRNQNSVTTLLKASNNVHAFDITTKRPGIIIGVMTFDVPRVYSKTIDRVHFHQNRFDDYIPQMQFVGDQQIWARELHHDSPVSGIFAYTLRYMEYKMRYHYAAGGAVDTLKSWFMITDNSEGNPFLFNINPDYIRSQPSEFDRFYSQLTGYSLGNYYHFIVVNKNYQDITRDMVLAPEPLK